MRKFIIGAAALLAVTAAPGIASAATGYVGAVYANTDVDHSSGSNDAWGAQGAVAFGGSSDIGFEVDAALVDSDAADTVSRLAGHVFKRNDSHLLGAFVAADHADGATVWSGGVEGNLYFQNWTLAAAVGYADANDADASAWAANVAARFFASDNLRLDAHVAYANIDYDFGGDDTATVLGVGAEYQFSAAPISVAASYDHDDFDNSNSANVWSLAVRYNFGGTLRERDRSGASQADLIGIAGLL